MEAPAMKFHVEDMTCGGCARAVTAAVKAIDPEARVDADPPTRTVQVETRRAEADVRAALTDAGFPPR
jgi:copper chaperone